MHSCASCPCITAVPCDRTHAIFKICDFCSGHDAQSFLCACMPAATNAWRQSVACNASRLRKCDLLVCEEYSDSCGLEAHVCALNGPHGWRLTALL